MLHKGLKKAGCLDVTIDLDKIEHIKYAVNVHARSVKNGNQEISTSCQIRETLFTFLDCWENPNLECIFCRKYLDPSRTWRFTSHSPSSTVWDRLKYRRYDQKVIKTFNVRITNESSIQSWKPRASLSFFPSYFWTIALFSAAFVMNPELATTNRRF